MTEVKHTPGPWEYVPRDDTPGHREGAFVKIGGRRWACTALVQRNTDEDALLISAAPDLLAACKTADTFLDHLKNSWEVCGHTQAMIDAIKAAIAKAEGR